VLEAVLGQFWFFEKFLRTPIDVMETYISWCDQKLNRSDRLQNDRAIRGGLTILFLILSLGAIGWIIAKLSQVMGYVWIVETILIMSFVTQGVAYQKLYRLAKHLKTSNLDSVYQELLLITHHPIRKEDSGNIFRRAIEACAGVIVRRGVGPIFWYILFGLPGLLVYSSTSIMADYFDDKGDKHIAFGFASRRLNNIFNYIPARLAGLIISIAAIFVPTAKPFQSIGGMHKINDMPELSDSGWSVLAICGALGFNLLERDQKDSDARHGPSEILQNVDLIESDLKRLLYLFTVVCLVNTGSVATFLLIRHL